jgi:hypothetical protein
MMGTSRRDDVTLGLAKKLETLIGNIARRVDRGESYDIYSPVVEMICRSYNPGWLIVARWHMEQRTPKDYGLAKEELRRFLENDSQSENASEAWELLGYASFQTNDPLGEVHAFVERAHLSNIQFHVLSNTANRLNLFLREYGLDIDREQKSELVNRMLQLLNHRISEAEGDDLSRMAWLAIHSGQESNAINFVSRGLKLDNNNSHLIKLAQRLKLNEV